MNTEERFLLRSSVEWRKNLMQDCLCMPCAEFSDSFDAAVDAAIATFPELEREAILKRYRDGLTRVRRKAPAFRHGDIRRSKLHRKCGFR